MLARLIVICLLAINAFGCALCSLYSPTAHVSAKFVAHENNITQIAFTWTFSQNFSDLMKQNFDLNQDEKIDEKELRKSYFKRAYQLPAKITSQTWSKALSNGH